MVLFSLADANWLLSRLSGSLSLVVDAATEARCEGEAILTGASGTLSSNPAGRRYCAGQQCAWHIFAAEDAGSFLVLNFTRFELECALDVEGRPQDYVRVYDGGTRSAPVLATYSCYSAPPLISSGPELLVEFFSDDVGREDTNYGGFSAEWVAGNPYCASLTNCDACAAGPCSWCETSASCLATMGAGPPLCAAENLTATAEDCCAPGFGGEGCAECAAGHFGSGCEPCTCDEGGCNDGAAGDGACDCGGGGDCTCGLRLVQVESLEEGEVGCEDGWDDPTCHVSSAVVLFNWDAAVNGSLPLPVTATAGMDVLWARVSATMPEGSPASVSLFYSIVGREYAVDAASANSTRQLPLKQGANAATLLVRAPGRVSACEIPVVIQRPPSSDTSFAEWSTTAYREQYDTLNRPLSGAAEAGELLLIPAVACPPLYSSCGRIFTASQDSILWFNILAGGAAVDAGCGRAAHACSNSTMLGLEAPGAPVVQGSPVGPKGDMSVLLRFPPGERRLLSPLSPVTLSPFPLIHPSLGGARHAYSARVTGRTQGRHVCLASLPARRAPPHSRSPSFHLPSSSISLPPSCAELIIRTSIHALRSLYIACRPKGDMSIFVRFPPGERLPTHTRPPSPILPPSCTGLAIVSCASPLPLLRPSGPRTTSLSCFVSRQARDTSPLLTQPPFPSHTHPASPSSTPPLPCRARYSHKHMSIARSLYFARRPNVACLFWSVSRQAKTHGTRQDWRRGTAFDHYCTSIHALPRASVYFARRPNVTCLFCSVSRQARPPSSSPYARRPATWHGISSPSTARCLSPLAPPACFLFTVSIASPLICFLPGETPVEMTVRAGTGDVARHLITV
jgi:hypothetical protein